MRPDIAPSKEVRAAAIQQEIITTKAELERLLPKMAGSIDVRASAAELRQIASGQKSGPSESPDVNESLAEIRALAEQERQDKIFQLQVRLEDLYKEARQLGIDLGEDEAQPLRHAA